MAYGVKDMLPRLKDVRDVIGNFAYYLGIKRGETDFVWLRREGRVLGRDLGHVESRLHRSDDLVQDFFFSFLPRWWIDIALAIHFYEAVLATLAIIVWHFYQVIFDPDVYPLNFALIDGASRKSSFRKSTSWPTRRCASRRKTDGSKAAEPVTTGEPEKDKTRNPLDYKS